MIYAMVPFPMTLSDL